jgi:hypothetical protein
MPPMSSPEAAVPVADVAPVEAGSVERLDRELESSVEAVAPLALEGAAPALMALEAAQLITQPATPTGDHFYAGLGEITEFRDVMELERYTAVPASSLLVLTDVVGSTKAIEAGRYKDVNALGVASIVAVCNAMRDVELPFVFGGDGATLIVPATRRAAAEAALRGVRALAVSAFDLGLRASIVPLAELAAAGHVARVARFRASEHARLAMFSGSAFSVAERWFKDADRGLHYEVSQDGASAADFDGFECRWQPLESQRGHTVSLIVRALSPSEAERTQTYKNLLHAFDRIVDGDACHPVKLTELKLNGWLGDYSVEARVRAQGGTGPGFAAAQRSARKQTLLGKLLTASGMSAGGFDGKRYKGDLVRNCDFRKFDDTLRMVVDLNVAEIYRLESRLAAEHRAGRLVYGLHRSSAALITCLVRSYAGDHVHFVDGAEGGYALAAKELKQQLIELEARGGKGPATPRPKSTPPGPPRSANAATPAERQ